MTGSAPQASTVAPIYREDPRLEPLIGPGGPFEVEEFVLDGVPLRDFVRAPRTIVDVFHMGAAHEQRVHVVHEGERLTFGEIRRQARSLARELQSSLGVRPGDRVAIAMRNMPEFVVSFWGAALAGAIVVPLNSWWTGDELSYALGDAGACVAFMDAERLERVTGAGRPGTGQPRAGQPHGVHLVGVRGATGDIPFDEIVSGAPIEDDAIALLDRDDPVTMLYTSGTTGRPKGALNTNRASIANIWNMAFVAARESLIAARQPAPARQPATLSSGPLFHIGGITTIISAQMGGTKMVMMRKWNVEEALRVAVDEELTSLGGVPTVARQILDHPGVERLGLDIRTFPMGGAAVPPDLPTRAVALFGDGLQILNGYGLTETTSAVVTNVGVEFAAHPDSVGRPNLTADVRVVDSDGRSLDAGEIGELCFRSPQVVKGYWNNEAATKTSFEDGWFHSGDVGYVGDDGFVYVVDRMKDVVIRGGENVYCAEVEAVLNEHPDVAEVAVVGLEEHAMGERVCAVIVPRTGTVVTLADVRAFAASRLAAFKRPEALYVMDELPKTATAKVAKNVVRELVAADPEAVDRLW